SNSSPSGCQPRLLNSFIVAFKSSTSNTGRTEGAGRWPARSSKGPLDTLTAATRVPILVKVPNLPCSEDLRVVPEVLPNIRASDIEKTQDSKRALGNIYRGWVLRGQVGDLFRTRSSS